MVTRYHVAGASDCNFLDDSQQPPARRASSDPAPATPQLQDTQQSHHAAHLPAMAPTTAPTLLWGGRFTGTINWHPRPPGLPNPNLLEELG